MSSTCMMLAVGFCLLLASTLPNLVGAGGSCKESGFCCAGRDSSCVVQKAPINAIIEDLSDEPCYCDHACLKLGDCCHDFKQACQVIDCETTEWGPWSDCDAECGPGSMSRSRKVVKEAANGGRICPELAQRRGCDGDACAEHHPHKAGREMAMILPASFAHIRTVNASKDIRRNLRLRYPKDPAKESSKEYCIEFEVVKGSKACHLDDTTKALQADSRVCVMCADIAMIKHLGYRCKGHGKQDRDTRFTSMNVASCHGRWVRKGKHDRCPCDNGAQFIFV